MNGPEKRVFILAVLLFVLGMVVKFSPWDPVPQIENFSYAEESFAKETFSEQKSQGEQVFVAELSASKPVSHKTSKKTKPAVHFPVHINKATANELCAIKGVGPKLAQKIIEFRSAHGPFSGPSDLKKVSGIGKKKAEAILTSVIFD